MLKDNFKIVFFIICLVVTIFYLGGLVFFLTDREPGDKCEMTYMFEYPQYVRIYQEIDNNYLKYGLYSYGEGRVTEKARNMQFNGIPVLFIPGNAGSHQQVRSLSSIALRKALNSETPFHFDYFTVDLYSEFSALYGPTLFSQLHYVLHSIKRVLELYKNSRNPPKQLVLIGHSVGGIVARKAIVELVKNKMQLVSVLITLAAPLVREPIYFDRYASNFYATSILRQDNITTVSIAGGHSDFLVPAYLTTNLGTNRSINLVATNIAKSWVESNHVQILWCKQLVMAINRALFDSVDRNTLQISSNADLVANIFRHHLIFNSGSMTQIKGEFDKPMKFDYRGEWIENIQKQYTVDFPKGIKQPHWFMTGLTNQQTYEMLTVLAVNLEVTDWVFLCNAAYPNKGSRVCLEGKHLTQHSEIVATSRYKRRLLTISLTEMYKLREENTHLVFRALPTSEQLTFHVDIYGSSEREAKVSLPIFNWNKHTIVEMTPEKAVLYNLIFPDLTDLLQIYQLYVEPIRCSNENHHATASLIVPWANESIHTHFTELLNKAFILRIQHPKPLVANSAYLRLILEPSCRYQISVRIHIIGIFGQLARYYSTFLISTMGVVFLLALQSQVHSMAETQQIPIFFSSLIGGLKHIWIIPVAYIATMILNNHLPEPEFKITYNIVLTGLAMMVLFMVSYITMFTLISAFCLSLFTLESTIHKFTLKILARSITLTFKFSDYFMTFLQKVPFIMATTLLVLCFSACGGLALCVGLVFYFLKLTQMSQEYVEQVAWFLLKHLAKKIKKTFCKSKNEKNLVNKEESKEQSSNEEVKKIENDETCQPPEGDRNNEDLPDTTNIGQDSGDHNQEQRILNSQEESNEQSSRDRELAKDIVQTHNVIFFHSSMFFIWTFVTVLNIPSVLTWAHDFKYSKNLSPDESLISGLIFSIGAFFLWQCDLPRLNRKFTTPLRLITLGLIPIAFLYSSVSIYRLNYMLTFLFALIMLQQIAPKLEVDEDSSTKVGAKEDRDKYNDMKIKMD
ncbi:hypothetical protein ABEB36_014713 [Hypothenemus hampei]|uniref:GPI inositol-deacylase n=1 Tax=Hypothenemus hampei TaxID=57062 RepID=A0ABD1E3H2_HYPHA